MNMYDFTVRSQDGSDISLSRFKGSVLLVVNTATGCGFTPQYEELEAFYREYRSKGLEILDFPCDQFGHQAPGSDKDIHQFCTLHYDTTFPQFSKICVNGPDAIPLYRWLTSETTFKGFSGPMVDALAAATAENNKDFAPNDIQWNFTKFLISREGDIIARFEPTDPMDDVRKAIEEALC